MKYEDLLAKYSIISDQIGLPALGVVLRELEKILQQGTEGDIVEFGCYIGTTSLFISRLLRAYQSDKTFHAYDSFEGLPPKTGPDASGAGEQFQAGELTVSKKQYLHEFKRANLPAPITHKSWFSDLAPEEVPTEIAFAFLDGDFYESIIDSLRLVWARLSQHGTITVDDYGRDALPGVERAVRDFFHDKHIDLRYEHNIAIIRRA